MIFPGVLAVVLSWCMVSPEKVRVRPPGKGGDVVMVIMLDFLRFGELSDLFVLGKLWFSLLYCV